MKWFFGEISRVKLGFQNGIWNPGLCLCLGCVYLRGLDELATCPCPRVGACVRRTAVGRTNARLRAGTVVHGKTRPGARATARQGISRQATGWAKQKGQLVRLAPLGCGLG